MAISSDPAGRNKIGGIKLSGELIQFNCIERSGTGVWAARFFRHLAQDRINVSFVCISSTAKGSVTSCCVDKRDFGAAKTLIEREPDGMHGLEIIAPVGTLTLFPHHYCLALLGRVMAELGKAELPIYAIGTSLSSLTFSTDYRLLDRAVGALTAAVELPPNHTPFRPEFRVQQM